MSAPLVMTSRDELVALAGQLFGPLAPLARQGRLVRLPVGTRVIVQENPTPPVYFLLSGIVKLQRAAPEGSENRAMIVDVAGPGNLLGAEAALCGGSSHLTCVVSKDVRAFEVAQNTFVQYLADNPSALQKVARGATRSVIARDASLAYAISGVETRLVAFLACMFRRFGSAGSSRRVRPHVDIGFTHTDLGDAIGASEGAVERAIKALKKQEIISTGYKVIYLRDPDSLMARLGYSYVTRTVNEIHSTSAR